jgi:transcriptional regulator with XRE-family HTH domain
LTTDRAPLFNFTPSERREYEKATLRYTAAAHLQNYLDDAGLRAKDLAQRIRKSRAWVSKLLSGRQNVTLDTLADVAWALGAKWQMDMVAADRIGTPAENDPNPPRWAVRSSSNITLTTCDGPVWYWTHQRSGTHQFDVDFMNMSNCSIYVTSDPNAFHGSNMSPTVFASSIQSTPKRFIASATASLQFSEGPA